VNSGQTGPVMVIWELTVGLEVRSLDSHRPPPAVSLDPTPNPTSLQLQVLLALKAILDAMPDLVQVIVVLDVI